MAITQFKEEAKKLIDNLSDISTWDDLIHEIYVRKTIERGLLDSKNGKLTHVKDVRKRYGLP